MFCLSFYFYKVLWIFGKTVHLIMTYRISIYVYSSHQFCPDFFLSGGKFKRVGDAQPAKRTFNDGMDSHGWNLSRAAAMQLS